MDLQEKDTSPHFNRTDTRKGSQNSLLIFGTDSDVGSIDPRRTFSNEHTDTPQSNKQLKDELLGNQSWEDHDTSKSPDGGSKETCNKNFSFPQDLTHFQALDTQDLVSTYNESSQNDLFTDCHALNSLSQIFYSYVDDPQSNQASPKQQHKVCESILKKPSTQFQSTINQNNQGKGFPSNVALCKGREIQDSHLDSANDYDLDLNRNLFPQIYNTNTQDQSHLITEFSTAHSTLNSFANTSNNTLQDSNQQQILHAENQKQSQKLNEGLQSDLTSSTSQENVMVESLSLASNLKRKQSNNNVKLIGVNQVSDVNKPFQYSHTDTFDATQDPGHSLIKNQKQEKESNLGQEPTREVACGLHSANNSSLDLPKHTYLEKNLKVYKLKVSLNRSQSFMQFIRRKRQMSAEDVQQGLVSLPDLKPFILKKSMSQNQMSRHQLKTTQESFQELSSPSSRQRSEEFVPSGLASQTKDQSQVPKTPRHNKSDSNLLKKNIFVEILGRCFHTRYNYSASDSNTNLSISVDPARSQQDTIRIRDGMEHESSMPYKKDTSQKLVELQADKAIESQKQQHQIKVNLGDNKNSELSPSQGQMVYNSQRSNKMLNDVNSEVDASMNFRSFMDEDLNNRDSLDFSKRLSMMGASADPSMLSNDNIIRKLLNNDVQFFQNNLFNEKRSQAFDSAYSPTTLGNYGDDRYYEKLISKRLSDLKVSNTDIQQILQDEDTQQKIKETLLASQREDAPKRYSHQNQNFSKQNVISQKEQNTSDTKPLNVVQNPHKLHDQNLDLEKEQRSLNEYKQHAQIQQYSRNQILDENERQRVQPIGSNNLEDQVGKSMWQQTWQKQLIEEWNSQWSQQRQQQQQHQYQQHNLEDIQQTQQLNQQQEQQQQQQQEQSQLNSELPKSQILSQANQIQLKEPLLLSKKQSYKRYSDQNNQLDSHLGDEELDQDTEDNFYDNEKSDFSQLQEASQKFQAPVFCQIRHPHQHPPLQQPTINSIQREASKEWQGPQTYEVDCDNQQQKDDNYQNSKPTNLLSRSASNSKSFYLGTNNYIEETDKDISHYWDLQGQSQSRNNIRDHGLEKATLDQALMSYQSDSDSVQFSPLQSDYDEITKKHRRSSFGTATRKYPALRKNSMIGSISDFHLTKSAMSQSSDKQTWQQKQSQQLQNKLSDELDIKQAQDICSTSTPGYSNFIKQSKDRNFDQIGSFVDHENQSNLQQTNNKLPKQFEPSKQQNKKSIAGISDSKQSHDSENSLDVFRRQLQEQVQGPNQIQKQNLKIFVDGNKGVTQQQVDQKDMEDFVESSSTNVSQGQAFPGERQLSIQQIIPEKPAKMLKVVKQVFVASQLKQRLNSERLLRHVDNVPTPTKIHSSFDSSGSKLTLSPLPSPSPITPPNPSPITLFNPPPNTYPNTFPNTLSNINPIPPPITLPISLAAHNRTPSLDNHGQQRGNKGLYQHYDDDLKCPSKLYSPKSSSFTNITQKSPNSPSFLNRSLSVGHSHNNQLNVGVDHLPILQPPHNMQPAVQNIKIPHAESQTTSLPTKHQKLNCIGHTQENRSDAKSQHDLAGTIPEVSINKEANQSGVFGNTSSSQSITEVCNLQAQPNQLKDNSFLHKESVVGDAREESQRQTEQFRPRDLALSKGSQANISLKGQDFNASTSYLTECMLSPQYGHAGPAVSRRQQESIKFNLSPHLDQKCKTSKDVQTSIDENLFKKTLRRGRATPLDTKDVSQQFQQPLEAIRMDYRFQQKADPQNDLQILQLLKQQNLILSSPKQDAEPQGFDDLCSTLSVKTRSAARKLRDSQKYLRDLQISQQQQFDEESLTKADYVSQSLQLKDELDRTNVIDSPFQQQKNNNIFDMNNSPEMATTKSSQENVSNLRSGQTIRRNDEDYGIGGSKLTSILSGGIEQEINQCSFISGPNNPTVTNERSQMTINDNFEIPFQEIQSIVNEKQNLINHGSLGEAYKGFRVYNPQLSFDGDVIVKVLLSAQPRNWVLDGNEFSNVINETCKLDHLNLGRILGWSVDPEQGTKFIVYEYCQGVCLMDIFHSSRQKKLHSVKMRLNYMVSIGEALCYIHEQEAYIVAYLKINKVIIDTHKNIKLISVNLPNLFGSNHVSQSLDGMDMYWDEAQDIYNLGIIICSLVTGLVQENNSQVVSQIDQFTRNVYNEKPIWEIVDRTAGKWDFDLALTLLNLALKCTAQREDDRPLVQDILNQLKALQNEYNLYI